MNNDPATCSKCGGAIPADAPQGLCPRCVLAGVAAPTEATRTTGPRVAAPPIESVRAAFPQLEILELIGQGGMGVVYKARQPKLDRLVALKILSGSLATDPTFEERFTREARTLAKLSHANIVTIYDHGRAGEFFYLLMEFVDGVNLRQAMAAGRFTASEALALVPRICEALQYAHEEGVLHRDIKPENILLDGRGRVKIADFGIAKMLGEAQPGGTLTASGAALGTPHYMSPEQIEHPSEVDHRTDIFSLGVVFYEMLTGELPLGRFGPPSAKSAVDRRVDEIVFRTLEKERELRQQSAGEVKTQLDTLSRTAAPPARDPQPAGSRTPRILKGQGCILIRPETMATFGGQMFAYQNRGQLLLDEERLTFTKDGFPTVIPLAAITDVSIGQYPRSMNPAGINLISLNYTEGTTDKRIYLSPFDGFFGFPAGRNQDVADWHSAIREAVVAVTGKPPGETPAGQLGIPRSSTVGLLLILALAGALALLFGSLIVLPKTGHKGINGHELFLIIQPMIAVLAGFILVAFFLNRSHRSAPAKPGANDETGPARNWQDRTQSLFNLWKPDGSFDVWKLVAWAVFAWVGTQLIGAILLITDATLGPLRGILFGGGFGSFVVGAGILVIAEVAVAAGFPGGQPQMWARRILTALKLIYIISWSPLLLSAVSNGSDSFTAKLLLRIGFAAALAGLWIFDRRRWSSSKTRTALVIVPMLCLGIVWGRFLPYSAAGSMPPPPPLAATIELPASAPVLAPPVGIPLETKPSSTPAAATPPMQDPIRDIELKVAKQQLEKTLNELADAQLELATSARTVVLTEGSPTKSAIMERLRYLDERSAILRKELQTSAANQEAGEAVVREVELRVTRDQYEKTLTALVEAKKELATSPAMMSYSDNHPTKKALLTKIQFLEERQAILKKELEEIHSREKPAAHVSNGGLPQILPAGTPSASGLKWHFAWVALTEKKKAFEAGVIPTEAILAAQRDLAVAEGEFLGNHVIVAIANVTYARHMLDLVRQKKAAGMATQRDVNEATLTLTQAEEALKKFQANTPTPSR